MVGPRWAPMVEWCGRVGLSTVVEKVWRLGRSAMGGRVCFAERFFEGDDEFPFLHSCDLVLGLVTEVTGLPPDQWESGNLDSLQIQLLLQDGWRAADEPAEYSVELRVQSASSSSDLRVVYAEFKLYRGSLNLTGCCFYGGALYRSQETSLKRGVDIVIGIPGHIKDHIERGNLNFNSLKFCVLDETDEMLKMEFVDDVELILGKVKDVPKV
ncbi:hypothetical protein GIB67_024418 [Kingdonia uniflora]|uniref:RNA helicase n=1 Tax=Kingdonia uniflora TaxID=39325 RepID=A0A7J7MH61_9MAGN|nr:hypothetical protein GIB67_024418 [Kingdonia uniflora]